MKFKNINIKKILYIALIVVLLAVFCVSAFYVISYYADSHKQSERYDDLAAMVESAQKATQPTESTAPGQEQPTDEISTELDDGTLKEYQALYEMNNDMVGWIKIEGTRVNYPVMQTPEVEDYYLYRNFDKEYSIRGSIYVREVCDVNLPSDNVTIYGHHMGDGSMFAGLNQYQWKDFWEEHDTITFDTLTEHHTYKIFAVFKTTATKGQGFAYHRFVDAKDEEEFAHFIRQCKALSFYDTGLTPAYGDKIICLSTCEYTLENGRFVVAAYRVS